MNKIEKRTVIDLLITLIVYVIGGMYFVFKIDFTLGVILTSLGVGNILLTVLISLHDKYTQGLDKGRREYFNR